MNSVTLVVLSRYRDLFDRFRANVDEYGPEIPRILVRSGFEIPHPGQGWKVYQGQEPFVYARNANLGFREAVPDDVLLVGDDVLFHSPFVHQLQACAYSDPKIGVATVQLWGQSPFVVGYFKRSILSQVGTLDEQYDGYGYEDLDWCRRMEALGYRTQTTETVRAEHVGGTSFYRREKEGGPVVGEEAVRTKQRFEARWGKEAD